MTIQKSISFWPRMTSESTLWIFFPLWTVYREINKSSGLLIPVIYTKYYQHF